MSEQTIAGTLTAITDATFKGVAIRVYAITTADGAVVEAGEPASAYAHDQAPVVDGATVWTPNPRGVIGDAVTVTGAIKSDGRLHFYGEDWTVA
jgi:hypothetical protein